MNPIQQWAWLSGRRAWTLLVSVRSIVALPLLALAIPGAAWGLSDPRTALPAEIPLDTPMHILFVTSLFVLLTATLTSVLYAWDGISRDRASGVLEVRLGRAMSRRRQTAVLLGAHLTAAVVPVLVLSCIAVMIVQQRTGVWPAFADVAVFLTSTALVVTWYTVIALLASSYARDQGTAIAMGVGVWFLFTMLWLLITSVLAGLAGIEAGTQDPSWVQFEALLDLASPNGVYHHLLELRLPDVDRGVRAPAILGAAVAWTVVPTWVLLRRMERLVP
jgi:ABC-type transport system involved in multi-copper enzyme maturation permease subunit